MRNFILRLSVFTLLICITFSGSAMITPNSSRVNLPMQLLYKKIISMKVKDFQEKLGRKLTLKEKVGFFILKQKAKHGLKKTTKNPEEKSSQGSTAFGIAILALVLFAIGFFVPALWIGSIITSIIAIVMGTSAYKMNPKDMKAHSAKLMGWIVLGLLALLALIAVIVVSSWWS